MLKPRKNTDFFFLVIYLKETQSRLKSIAFESSYYLGKDGNIGKEVLGMVTCFAPSSLFTQASGITHRGKICSNQPIKTNPKLTHQKHNHDI